MTMVERIEALVKKDMEATRLQGEVATLRHQVEQERQAIGAKLGEGVHLVGDSMVRVRPDNQKLTVEIVAIKVWKEPAGKERP